MTVVTTQKFWKVVKSLKGIASSTLPQQIKLDSKIENNKREICNAFNDHFIKSSYQINDVDEIVVAQENVYHYFRGSESEKHFFFPRN